MARTNNDIDLLVCDLHGRYYIWYHRDDGCSACADKERHDEELKAERKKATQLRKDIKLLRYELAEERKKHGLTKLEAADYLAEKQKVRAIVDDKLQ